MNLVNGLSMLNYLPLAKRLLSNIKSLIDEGEVEFSVLRNKFGDRSVREILEDTNNVPDAGLPLLSLLRTGYASAKLLLVCPVNEIKQQHFAGVNEIKNKLTNFVNVQDLEDCENLVKEVFNA